MIEKGMTIKDAARDWVRGFNAIQTGMIEMLMKADPENWEEVTTPAPYDRVYIYGLPGKAESRYGEILSYDAESELYCVVADDETRLSCERDDFELEHDDVLPMWGTMWSFGDNCGDYWLEENDGIRVMSGCGFRIYHHEEFGYFFGIDGAGYDFYEDHWIPLYKARGLHWHDPDAEHEYQMRRNGYEQKTFCGQLWWCKGGKAVEKINGSVAAQST